MPTYVVLTNYTEDGFEALAEVSSDEFLEQSKELIREHGGEPHEYYLTMGQYDAIGIVEFPDDTACAEAMLSLLEQGGIETETMRAFTEEQTRELIGTLGG